MQTKDCEYLNDVQGAALINYAPQTLRNYRLLGKGPAYIKIGRKILYCRDDLLAWVERHRVIPQDEVA